MIEKWTRPSNESLAEFLFEWTSNDESWLIEEFGHIPPIEEMLSYLQTYEGMGCIFRLWLKDDNPVAFTAVLPKAPSNQKSWLGTIVVNPVFRERGIGKSVIDEIMADKANVVFAGVPYEQNEWSLFLGKCGFEQYGIEGEKKQYLVLVHPNEKE